MKPFITVIGNVATGKSTMTEFLGQKLNAHVVKADELYKTNPFFQDAVVDRNRWSLSSDTWFLMKRVEMAKKVRSLLKRQGVVQDSGLLMSWVYANSRLGLGQMNNNESTLYNELFETLTKNLPQETLVVSLSLPIKTLRQRIEERGREFEITFHSEEYLEHVEQSLTRLRERLTKQKVPLLALTETHWYDIVGNTKDQQSILAQIKNHI